MRGYFALGVEGLSKAGNLGNLVRSAHAFGASYVFTIGSPLSRKALEASDTSRASGALPSFHYPNLAAFEMPQGAQLVVAELTDEAVPLPSFRHPARAVYLLGPERESVSAELQARADYLVQIPMKFCVNLATAGAILLYDRLLQQGRFPDRPVVPGGPLMPLEPHQHGGHFSRIKKRAARAG